MRNVLGDNLTITLFGESHSPKFGATLDGFPAGIKISESAIRFALSRRRPVEGIDSARIEEDEFEIISGVMNGYSTGAPITIIINNNDVISNDYYLLKDTPRPGQTDYVMKVKYDGYNDFRGGGHFSGRVTAAIVALGEIVLTALKEKGIYIGTHVYKCGEFHDKKIESVEEINYLNSVIMPIIDGISGDFVGEILKVRDQGDSIGGITETVVMGVPAGVGEPIFSSLEGKISNAMFSIGGVKGVEFGDGFFYANKTGSMCVDEFTYEKGKVVTKENHSGGINGGVCNGMPIVFRCVVKPTSSISKPQATVNLKTKENVEIEITGRHDPAIVRRIPVIMTSLTAIVILDALLVNFGEDYFKK